MNFRDKLAIILTLLIIFIIFVGWALPSLVAEALMYGWLGGIIVWTIIVIKANHAKLYEKILATISTVSVISATLIFILASNESWEDNYDGWAKLCFILFALAIYTTFAHAAKEFFLWSGNPRDYKSIN